MYSVWYYFHLPRGSFLSGAKCGNRIGGFMEHFIIEHGGVLVSGIVSIMTIVIMFLFIEVMGNVDLESIGTLLG